MIGSSACSIDRILGHLGVLVGADSSDPERTVTPDHPALRHAARVLEDAGCTVRVTDLGGGCVNLFARRGDPSVLFNCHLDTVKPNPGWTRDPFELSVESGRAYGLGACDIKGAAACMLSVAETTDAPLAVLFSTDEEAGKGVCVESFLAQHADPGGTVGFPWSCVVVAEPTESKAVLQHRGFASFEIVFRGAAGHTSGADASDRSAVHQAIEWGHRALELARPGGLLENARFNIGIVEGGSGSNVIAADATVRFGFRPSPAPDAEAVTAQRIAALKDLLPSAWGACWRDRFIGPALVRRKGIDTIVAGWGIELGADVDFWTEAALFAKGGLPAVVLGPGSIAQAHASDEFVGLDQLSACAAAYARVVTSAVMAGGTHAP